MSKRRRFPFRLRHLMVLVTLVCLYLGAWRATELWGVAAVRSLDENFIDVRRVAACVVVAETCDGIEHMQCFGQRRFYLVLPGWTQLVYATYYWGPAAY